MGRNRLVHQTSIERANVDAVCHHLALVAIDGATDEVEAMLADQFVLHLDGFDTDRSGYLALIDANRESFPGGRPPLDVVTAYGSGDFVTARLEPRCLAHFRLTEGSITELWMTIDWPTWSSWLVRRDVT